MGPLPSRLRDGQMRFAGRSVPTDVFALRLEGGRESPILKPSLSRLTLSKEVGEVPLWRLHPELPKEVDAAPLWRLHPKLPKKMPPSPPCSSRQVVVDLSGKM